MAACNANSGGSSNSGDPQAEDKPIKEVASLDTTMVKVVNGMIIPTEKPCVVDFNATWCGPCKTYSPIFESVATEYAEAAIFLSIDVDQYPEIANKYEVQSIPCTVFILPGGGVMSKEVGVIDKQRLDTFMNQLIATNAGSGDGI